jgi:hypothetical protein
MATQGNDRREFLKLGGAALATTAVSWNAKSYAAVVGANDRVKVGIVGCGDRMKGGDLPAFQQHAKDMNFEIVAVSDIWNRRREEGAAYIQKLSGCTVTPVRNNDELYARKDVDAVISLPPTFNMRGTEPRLSMQAGTPTWRNRSHTPWRTHA